jgi:Zn-dependent M28 family amino/carboxypeptidase
MNSGSRKKKKNVQIFNKSAFIRLVILFVLLFVLSVWAWLTMFRMPEKSYGGELPPLKDKEILLQASLKQDLQKIADEIGLRNHSQYKSLDNTRQFIENTLTEASYKVKRQKYKVKEDLYYNLAVEKLGTEKPNEIVVVGGHYDSAFNSPGANDNGTGAAATLELARLFANQPTKRTLRFVEFVNEEPPFFTTKDMGSLVYANQSNREKENIVAMLSLETMGYFSDAKNSQKYPFPINFFYPNQGNFIGFIGNLDSGDLVRQSILSFRRHAQFPSQGASLPSWIPGVSWSDQWAFWQQGYKGIMITDTAPFRYPFYHTEKDTIDKIDFNKLTRVVSGLADVISDLAN